MTTLREPAREDDHVHWRGRRGVVLRVVAVADEWPNRPLPGPGTGVPGLIVACCGHLLGRRRRQELRNLAPSTRPRTDSTSARA
jgi:hypothetical protein